MGELKKLRALIDSLEEVNAHDIKIYVMKDSHLFDYGVVATAVASRQMDGLISKINEKKNEYDIMVRGCEGRGGSGWLLIDVGFAIVNLFTLEDRSRYDLDKIWAQFDQLDYQTLQIIE